MEEAIQDAQEDRLKDLETITKVKSKKQNSKITVEFSWKFLIAVALILGLIFFSQQLVILGVFLFVGFVVMSSAKPVVKWFTNRKLGKGWAIFLTYFLGTAIFLGISAAILIPFLNEFKVLMQTLPSWFEETVNSLNSFKIFGYTVDLSFAESYINTFLDGFSISNGFQNIAGTLSGVFNWFTIITTSIIFSIYLLWDHDTLLDIALVRITSDRKKDRVRRLVLDVESKLGHWLLGQLTVSSIAGAVLGTALVLLNVPFALPLAVLIALFDAIPNIGATLATIPAVTVALFVGGPGLAFLVLVIFIMYQQVENNFIIPKIMGNAVGLRPVIVMLGAMVFFVLFGLFGALVAVPFMVIAQILYDFYLDLQKLTAEGIV